MDIKQKEIRNKINSLIEAIYFIGNLKCIKDINTTIDFFNNKFGFCLVNKLNEV